MNAHLLRSICFTSLVAIVLVACKSRPALTDGSSVESDIRAHLRIGSSEAEVQSYLDKRQIPHHWLERGEPFFITSSLVDPDTGLPMLDAPTIQGFISHSETNLFVVMSGIVIDFKFDPSGSRLMDFKVQELLTGP
jgi:hypothetical protein